MKLKQKRTCLALVLMAALVLPLSAISPLPVQEAKAVEAPVTVAKVTTTAEPVAKVTANAAEPAAVENRYHVTVDGVPMTEDPMVTALNGVSYVSLRSMVNVLTPDAQISWSGGVATVRKEGVLTLTAKLGQTYIEANGRYLPVPGGVQAKNGAVLLPLDTVAKATNATYTWGADGSLALTTGTGGILSGDQFYNADDLYWLSRIIYSESGNQPLGGKIAVGNVVLNRVKSPRFPNTIHGVIFQRNQFSPAANGTIKRTPNAESVMAAKLCLDGAVELENVLWFNRVGLKSWASRNCTFVATIAQHSFYA